MAPDTAWPRVRNSAGADDSGTTPAGVLSQLYITNANEIQLANVAAKQATSPEVRRVARRLSADHSKNREQLLALAQKLSVSLHSSAGGNVSQPDTNVVPLELRTRSGPDFDRAYLRHEIGEHRNNIDRVRSRLVPAAPNDAVKTYLKKTLTEMRDHLADLEQVQEQISS